MGGIVEIYLQCMILDLLEALLNLNTNRHMEFMISEGFDVKEIPLIHYNTMEIPLTP